ncbi:MAG: hypothetical protein PHF25_03695 [Candidatus Margulisbacteria bacterium]|nr:hypothetical protein [Candidatus Margulisiibacteriota bacterium]
MRKILVRGAVFLILMSMAFASAISDVRITDVRSDSFAVSWVSDELEEGSLDVVGEEGPFLDKRVSDFTASPAKKFKLHYVIVNADPNTNYSFKIKSGSTTFGPYSVKTTMGGIAGTGVNVAGKVKNTTFVDMVGYFEAEDVQNVYYEMFIEKPDGTRSAIRSGISGYIKGDSPTFNEWEASSAPFLDQTNTSLFSYNNNDILVVTFINYSRGYDNFSNNLIGSKRVNELRIPVNVTRADVTMFDNPIPVIDNFDSGSILGWSSSTSNISLSLVNNNDWVGAGGALEVSASSADAVGYNGYFMYDFSTLFYDPAKYGGSNIKTNKAYDWGRHKYIKFSVKNAGSGPVDLKLDVKDVDHDGFGFVVTQDDEWVYNLNFLKNDGQWRDIYIPLSAVLLSKNNVDGDGVFNPLQRFTTHDTFTDIYPGVPMLGFAVSAGKAGASAKLIIENIELVDNIYNSNNVVELDTDGDGITDADEIANGLDPNDPSDAKEDPDGDGIDNYNEILNGTNPFIADFMSKFPEIDNFEKGMTPWTIDGALVASTANTTDVSVSWNYHNSMLISGPATGYYVGGIQKDILSDVTNWTNDYKMLSMLIKANGQVGDKIVVKLEEVDGDVWKFEQIVGDLNTWTYLGMLLDRFKLDPNAISTGNRTQNFDQTRFIRIELISAKPTGTVSMYVDNINVSTSDISGDTDGDGIPNWFEVSNNLNVLVANTGDTDGDGWSDLEEYVARTNPNQWTPHFPLIDNFERVGYPWLADGINIYRIMLDSYPTRSLLVNGIASNYFGGFVGAYIYNPLNTMPEVYKSLTMYIDNSNGMVGDKIEVQLQDKDGDAFSFTQVLITEDWKWYTFVLDNFVKTNPAASGNGVFNLEDLSYVGYTFVSATKNGVINMRLDEIALSTVPTSDDTDGDGLPNWWEELYGLDPNVANINPSGDLTDTDGDNITDLDEYLMGLDPTKKVLFPEIDNFELIGGIPLAGNWSKTAGTQLSYEKTTDKTVSWNLDWSMYVETVASSNYYNGTMFKTLDIPNSFWTADYMSLKYLARSFGSIGDKLIFTITDSDGDEFSFTQTFADFNKWTYYTLLLDRFELTNSAGNGVKDFANGVSKLAINLISSTATGNMAFSIDNITVSKVPTSNDTDGDGIPNWFEDEYGLNVNEVNTGDIDGDGWSDLEEYTARTNPTQWTPHFPLIDNFERVGYPWLADGISITRSTVVGYPTTSLLVNGIASNYFGGFVGAYIYNPLNTMPKVYKSLTMYIDNSNGMVGDKIEVQLQDKDGDAFSFTQVLITADWKWYTFVLDNFVKTNSAASGNGVFNLEDLSYVGYTFVSATKNGVINMKLDEIALSTVPTSDDTDGDGLPNWWEELYGLDPNVANINPSGDLTDTDGDNITDLEEYLRGLDPTKKVLFPVIDNFETANGIKLSGAWINTIGVDQYYEKTTDKSVSWNLDWSLYVETAPAVNYYAGSLLKNTDIPANFWTDEYKSLKFLAKNYGEIGDKLIFIITDADGDEYSFTQTFGDLNTWNYYTLLLDRFELTKPSGNSVMNFANGVPKLAINLISATPTGEMYFRIDNLNVSETPTSNDTDGDGIPNWFEDEYGLNPLVKNTGDTDGDGWTDLEEYVARTNPNQWTPHFPLIDNFERVGYPWLADGISITRSTVVGYPTTSLLVNGIASNYFGGFVGAYIYNPLNTMPEVYKSLKMYINNSNGMVGDKLSIQLQDVDGDVFGFTQVLITSDWTWYTFVLDNFVKINSVASGNGVFNLEDLAFVGYSFVSATANGVINVKLDEIVLSTVPTSDDTDGDGLPNWWEELYELDPNVANINPSGDLTDTDDDGLTDLEEYLMYPFSNPNQGYLRHVLKGWNFFSIVNEGGQNISDVVSYLETKLGVGSIEEAAIWDKADGEFVYMSQLDFPVAYGQSYYIKSNVRKTITPSATATMPQSYVFTTGWNLLGKPVGKAYKSSELLAEINDRNGDKKVDALDMPLRAIAVKVYDNYYYNGWLHYRADNTGTDFTVGATYKSYGFMIQLTEDFTWTPKKDL